MYNREVSPDKENLNGDGNANQSACNMSDSTTVCSNAALPMSAFSAE
jgi:hypothetical protein